jgi:hypothetical protein
MSARLETLLPEIPLAGERPAPDYVEFWHAGAPATGTFCCAACGWAVSSVRRLPDCPSCGGSVWEQAVSSPFGSDTAQQALAEDAWLDEEVQSVAGLTRGVAIALVLAPVYWLVPLVVLYALIHG